MRADTPASSGSSPWRTLAHVMGNVLLGVAIGLVAYAGITFLQGWALQRDVKARLVPLGAIAVAAPPVEKSGPTLDFEGWEEEDAAYWNALPEGGAFGRLVIPRIDLDTGVVKGSSRPDLQKGPGWIEWTELPGPEGTAGIAGHRTTYLAPFRAIDQLKPGDRVRFYSPYRRYTYQVVRVVAVRPSETEIMDSGPEPMLNLSACHPPYSARQRLVAVSKLMEVKQLDQSK